MYWNLQLWCSPCCLLWALVLLCKGVHVVEKVGWDLPPVWEWELSVLSVRELSHPPLYWPLPSLSLKVIALLNSRLLVISIWTLCKTVQTHSSKTVPESFHFVTLVSFEVVLLVFISTTAPLVRLYYLMLGCWSAPIPPVLPFSSLFTTLELEWPLKTQICSCYSLYREPFSDAQEPSGMAT